MITLRHLHADNFKGLRDIDLTFPDRGSILIEGHNEAGKSTLFEAVYVALYGEPLIGEETRPRLEEVIQHGQPRALVELTFTTGLQELQVRRVFRREQAQQAQLTIRQPDGTEEIVNRARAVNQRILQELNNLDGDNLRNSCFVEQKELGRLEEMDSAKREQAIQKLLGLEHLTKLADQFKFRREQERALNDARHLLELAYAQADIRETEAAEQALAERLDAATVASHLHERGTLITQQAALREQLSEGDQREHAARIRLQRGDQVRAALDKCQQTEQRLGKAISAAETASQLQAQLAELDRIEQQILPEANTHRGEVLKALNLITAVEDLHERIREAEMHQQEAQRATEALARAEEAVRERQTTLTTARTRATQRRQEAEVAQNQQEQRLTTLTTRDEQLTTALARVSAWEQARERLETTQRDMHAAEDQLRALSELRATLRKQETAASEAEQAAQRAEQERERAEAARRSSEGRSALQDWIRLKEVEFSLAGFAQERARLEHSRTGAHGTYTNARAQIQQPQQFIIALGVASAAALLLGVMLTWVFLLLAGIFMLGAAVFWLRYRQATEVVRKHARVLSEAEQRLRDLEVQYQASVRAGGDPVLLGQRERELRASGLSVPHTLDEARALLSGLPVGTSTDYQLTRTAADQAVATAAQHAAEAAHAREVVTQTRATLQRAEAAGVSDTQIQSLCDRATTEQSSLDAAETAARTAIDSLLPWPTTSTAVQVALAASASERRTLETTKAEAAAAAARAKDEDMAAMANAEKQRSQAEEACTALRATAPEETLASASTALRAAEDALRMAEAQAATAAETLGLKPTRASIESERGRVEERLRTLETQVATRPSQNAKLTATQAQHHAALATANQHLKDLNAECAQFISSHPGPLTQTSPASADLSEADLSVTLAQMRSALGVMHTDLDENGARVEVEAILQRKGTITQNLRALGTQQGEKERAIHGIFAARRLPTPTDFAQPAVEKLWPLVADIKANEVERLQRNLDLTRNQLYAARDREQRLSEELNDPGAQEIETCTQRVRELEEARAICQQGAQIIHEARERIVRQVLPTTERNMQLLLPELTAQRYWDVRLTPPEGEDGQPGQLDYRIRVWDSMAGRYVAKNLFSGGTRDQCSLALRLAFALATLPQELGVAPGFIFLDEPLSAFDSQRAQALVDLLTTGTIAQQFAQVLVISHHHAFDRRAFQYHLRLEAGRVVESDLVAMPEAITASARRQA